MSPSTQKRRERPEALQQPRLCHNSTVTPGNKAPSCHRLMFSKRFSCPHDDTRVGFEICLNAETQFGAQKKNLFSCEHKAETIKNSFHSSGPRVDERKRWKRMQGLWLCARSFYKYSVETKMLSFNDLSKSL